MKLAIGYRCQHDPNIQAYMKVGKERLEYMVEEWDDLIEWWRNTYRFPEIKRYSKTVSPHSTPVAAVVQRSIVERRCKTPGQRSRPACPRRRR